MEEGYWPASIRILDCKGCWDREPHPFIMSTQAVKTPPLRVFWCRRMELNLDLNTPPIENQDQEGTSNQDISQQMVKNKSQTNHGRACIVDVDSGEEMTSGQKRRRGPAGEPLIEFYDLINLEGSRSSLVQEKKSPLPKESSFSCPICMGPFVEETFTRCGHIFCKACIRAAITAQPRCPTCREPVTVRGLIKVFLPAINSV